MNGMDKQHGRPYAAFDVRDIMSAPHKMVAFATKRVGKFRHQPLAVWGRVRGEGRYDSCTYNPTAQKLRTLTVLTRQAAQVTLPSITHHPGTT